MLRTDDQIALITSINPRAEKHGDDTVPACDIGLTFETGQRVLDHFHKDLRKFLYTEDAPKNAQLELKGTGNDTPYLRFNGTLGPLKIEKEYVGYKAQIGWGEVAGSVQVALADVRVKRITA